MLGNRTISSPGLRWLRRSFKYVKLCAGFGSEGTTWIYANPEALVNAAVTGVFTPTTRWDYWSQPKEKRLDMDEDQVHEFVGIGH
ncbi:MAG: hypothetical protein ROO76_13155 [Terriglobia bacterium]|nr:hypothetical protein [Terriglobia bacterium]